MTDALLDPVVSVRDLCVRFGSRTALHDVSFTVESGRILAIVGANGAGKSTLFRAITGLVPADQGSVELLGCSSAALSSSVRARVAFVSEEHAEMPEARVRELIAFRRKMYRTFDDSIVRALLDRAKIADASRFGELSRGQRALTVVGLALAQGPDLLLLDDPTLGLDPLARRTIVQSVLAAARSTATTVIIATHEITDVERIADDLLLLSRGRVASPAQEIEAFVSRSSAVTLPAIVAHDELRAMEGVLYVWPRRDHVEVILHGDADARAAACDALAQRTRSADSLTQRDVSLEEATLAWLAHDSDEGAIDHG